MPFIRRQRKYYKDGVEVPSSSITDFGSYKYFKNVVTTKYWKEITTGSRELEYACYIIDSTKAYIYLKEISIDAPVYGISSGGKVDDSSLLTIQMTSGVLKSVNEDSLTYNIGIGYDQKATRSYVNDLYKDTTTTTVVEGTPEDYTYTTEEIVPVEVTADDNYDFTEFVPSAEFDYYEDKNSLYTLTRRLREYYKYGTELNATVVGSFAKIDKGVARGFSASQYLVHPVAFTPNTQTWERVFKYITGSTVTDGTVYSNGTVDKCGDSLFIYGSKPRLLVGYTASAWNVDSTANYTLYPNTSYWFKISFTGTSYNMDVSTNGTDYENIISVASSTVITTNMSQLNIGQRLGHSSPLTSGSIDLNQSYIKINDELWWSGDSYTKVGSWIDNGVVSGFTTSNYLKLPKTFNSQSNTWEIIVKGNITNTSANNNFVSGQTNPIIAFFINTSGKLSFNIGNGSSWVSGDISGTTAISMSTDYYFKLQFNGTQYISSYSTDGLNWNQEAIYTGSVSINNATLLLGITRNIDVPFKGSIDLSQSYIKINGEEWWHGTKAVKSTEDDTDYHVDRNKFYNLTRRLQRNYYKNWTQPVNPTGITTSGWTNATQAFDGVNSTYADTKSNSAYIEYDFGQELYVTGFDAVGWWVNGIAHDSALDIYSVDKDGVETLIKAGTAGSDSANYPTSAKFPAVKTSKVRFKAHDTLGYQVRIREITVSGYADGTKDDYDYYVDKNITY